MNREQIYDSTIDYYLAPIADLRDDPTVTEIMINGPQLIYVERGGRLSLTDHSFPSEDFLISAVSNMAEYVNRPFDDRHLTLDGRLPDGSRIHVISQPVSRSGLCVTIRKFRASAFTLDELVERGSIDPAARNIIEGAIHEHLNMVVAGGTGTGKTSLLNALSRSIDPAERIVVIEENNELKLVQPHTIYLESRPEATAEAPAFTLRELFVHALRMRPDRILIGEVRRGEALTMVQAMLSGHAGSLSTLHASTPQAAATRLETLCLMNDAQLPVYVARAQVAAAIDLFVQTQRLTSGHRCITEIARLVGLNQQHDYVWESVYKKNHNEQISDVLSAAKGEL